MNRKLTKQERALLIRGLNSLLEENPSEPEITHYYLSSGRIKPPDPKDKPLDPKPFIDQIDELRVVDECECGYPSCHTVTFQHAEKGKWETIVNHCTEDGRMLLIDVSEDTGLLAGLEVHY